MINFFHDGESWGNLEFAIKIKNNGNVTINRAGISLFVESETPGKRIKLSRQDSFKDLAPKEYLDVHVLFEKLNLDTFPDEIKLTYFVTGLNIPNPAEEIMVCQVNFDDFPHDETYDYVP